MLFDAEHTTFTLLISRQVSVSKSSISPSQSSTALLVKNKLYMSGFFVSGAPPLSLLFSWAVTSEVNAVRKQRGLFIEQGNESVLPW